MRLLVLTPIHLQVAQGMVTNFLTTLSLVSSASLVAPSEVSDFL